jgi:glycosyltransferase involved in cell wall biosynthesis
MEAMEQHCRRCAGEMSSQGFDLLLAHPCLFFRVSPIAKHSHLPKVLYLQEPFRELYEAWPEFPWAAPVREYRPYSKAYWRNLFWELIALENKRVQVREELAWAKSFDQILVNSLFSRESLMRAYHLDSRVCYLGVDTGNFKPTGSSKESFVIGLGSLSFNKRPMLAVQAVAAIPREKRPKLVWVGNVADKPLMEKIQNEAKKLGVDFILKVLIPDEELRDLLSKAAAMIYTSYLEPFGYAPMEANACGTAVVAIAEGGVRESVGNPASGVLVSSADPQELANALMRFTDNLEFATEFGQGSRHYVEQHWSLDLATDRLEEEFNRVLKMRSAIQIENSDSGMKRFPQLAGQ